MPTVPDRRRRAAAGLVVALLGVLALVPGCRAEMGALPPPSGQGLGVAAPAGDGCAKDTDCKGDRVCESGRCVAPH